MGRDALLR